MNREDFPFLRSGVIHFDNGATTLKPQVVIDKVSQYYSDYTSNAHRGDYDNSIKVDKEYENVRSLVKDYINAADLSEVVFNKGTTEGLNQVVFAFMKDVLKEGDEVILSKSEHASNVLPWIILAQEKKIVIRYADLDDNYELTLEAIKKEINAKTKVISIAHVTNTIGDIRPIEEIGAICQEKDIYFVVDAAQSIGHLKLDVQETKISFLTFSAHKILGPTGVGVLYGKKELLEIMKPFVYGGGMNAYFEADGSYELRESPVKFEGGTQDIAGILGLGSAIEYINSIGLSKIHEYELELKRYAISKLKELANIKIYNEKSQSSTILFNIDKVFSQDTALFLNEHKINVRSGNHCAKILKDEIKTTNSCRISLYFYNTKVEIDKLIEVLEKQEEVYDKIIG